MTSLSDDPHALAGRLRATLDPVMTSNGFAAGQSGSSAFEVGVVYCSDHHDFRRRFPDLAPSIEYSDDGACTDLNIYVDVSGPARLREIHLDGHTLDELAHDVGRDDLRSCIQRLSGEPIDEGTAHLRELLTAILSTASRTSGLNDKDRNA